MFIVYSIAWCYLPTGRQVRQPGLKPNSKQKAEDIFVAPPYCQTECCVLYQISTKIRFCHREKGNFSYRVSWYKKSPILEY